MKFGIGASIRRKEDSAFITGKGSYLSDRIPEDTAYAYVVRSPLPHARFSFGNLDEVRGMDGVLSVLTADDVSHVNAMPCVGQAPNTDGTPLQVPRYPILAEDVVRYVGDAVAMIVAGSFVEARNAAEALEVEWDALPAVADMQAAIASDAPQVWPDRPGNIAFDAHVGDKDKADAAFAEADRVVTLELVNNRLVSNYMEPRGAIGAFDPQTGRYTLTCGSQGTGLIQNVLAGMIFGLPKERFHIITPDTGGGFGTKLFIYREYPLVLVAAEKVGRPVTWVSDRSEHFLADAHGRDNVSRAELALDAKGRFLGLRVDTLANMGGYLAQFGPFVAHGGAGMLPGIYRFRNVHGRVRGIYTNTVPVDAYRGAGRPEAAYLIERLVDKAARELGMKPDALRRKNFIPPSSMPWKTPTDKTYDSGEFDGHMRQAMDVSDWKGFNARLRDSRKAGKLRGIGLATYIEACAGGAPETARVALKDDGTIFVNVGTQSTGQGHLTAYAQVVSERLGIDPERITVLQGDSDAYEHGSFTGGSRSLPVGGAAVSESSVKLGERIKAKAADMLETATSDLEFGDGVVTIAGTDRSVSFAEIAEKASEAGEELVETDSWTPPEATYPNGSHVVEVEIDPGTGHIDIVRYTVVDDFGVLLNPMLLEGQVHGGIAQGIGQALLEHTAYDADGQLLAASLQDYTLPRADNVPSIHFETRNVPCTTNLLGMKGAGEAGAIGACPAVVNAVVDALYRAAGITHIDMPVTPEKVWRALSEAEAAAA
ncbi:xanthine dehydrogenase family protein molybdopterin-binding subunit [Microbaculum marinum]|uniref:Xanthine dehydrogenase family protein molybdopterin-binding subunit n=1 Tax=Microbaculum marinum TaxID=1764581 RepID=A0AAW9S599_9HYPH